eukprot:Rmarinus@m.1032
MAKKNFDAAISLEEYESMDELKNIEGSDFVDDNQVALDQEYMERMERLLYTKKKDRTELMKGKAPIDRKRLNPLLKPETCLGGVPPDKRQTWAERPSHSMIANSAFVYIQKLNDELKELGFQKQERQLFLRCIGDFDPNIQYGDQGAEGLAGATEAERLRVCLFEQERLNRVLSERENELENELFTTNAVHKKQLKEVIRKHDAEKKRLETKLANEKLAHEQRKRQYEKDLTETKDEYKRVLDEKNMELALMLAKFDEKSAMLRKEMKLRFSAEKEAKLMRNEYDKIERLRRRVVKESLERVTTLEAEKKAYKEQAHNVRLELLKVEHTTCQSNALLKLRLEDTSSKVDQLQGSCASLRKQLLRKDIVLDQKRKETALSVGAKSIVESKLKREHHKHEDAMKSVESLKRQLSEKDSAMSTMQAMLNQYEIFFKNVCKQIKLRIDCSWAFNLLDKLMEESRDYSALVPSLQVVFASSMHYEDNAPYVRPELYRPKHPTQPKKLISHKPGKGKYGQFASEKRPRTFSRKTRASIVGALRRPQSQNGLRPIAFEVDEDERPSTVAGIRTVEEDGNSSPDPTHAWMATPTADTTASVSSTAGDAAGPPPSENPATDHMARSSGHSATLPSSTESPSLATGASRDEETLAAGHHSQASNPPGEGQQAVAPSPELGSTGPDSAARVSHSNTALDSPQPTIVDEGASTPITTRSRPSITANHNDAPNTTRSRHSVTAQHTDAPNTTRSRHSITAQHTDAPSSPNTTRSRHSVTANHSDAPASPAASRRGSARASISITPGVGSPQPVYDGEAGGPASPLPASPSPSGSPSPIPTRRDSTRTTGPSSRRSSGMAPRTSLQSPGPIHKHTHDQESEGASCGCGVDAPIVQEESVLAASATPDSPSPSVLAAQPNTPTLSGPIPEAVHETQD